MPFIQANGIQLHFLDNGPQENKPTFLLLHGVTANAHAFDGILAAGFEELGRCIRPDLRGRGLSDHPASDYDVPDHAADIIGLLDGLGIDQVIVVGHSYGALLGLYLAAYFPKRLLRLVVMDAAARMNPRVGEMLGLRFAMLDAVFQSREAYLQAVHAAPYNTFWDEAMQSYYDADIRPALGGGVTPRSLLANIVACSIGLSKIEWPVILETVRQPVLMIHAPDVYMLGEPLLPEDLARESFLMLRHGTFTQVPGNHQTMLYGPGAPGIVSAVQDWMAR